MYGYVCAFQDVSKYFHVKKMVDMGNAGPPTRGTDGQMHGGAGGMAGTANVGSLQTILGTIRRYQAGRDFEVFDAGLGSGVVAVAAMAYGASFASGIECKDEGGADVMEGGVRILERHGVHRSKVQGMFDAPVSRFEGASLPFIGKVSRAVYAFCDGWKPNDRVILFWLVGADALVTLFICSPGKAENDPFRRPEQILAALNTAAAAPRWAFVEQLAVRMFGSQAGKQLFVFTASHTMQVNIIKHVKPHIYLSSLALLTHMMSCPLRLQAS